MIISTGTIIILVVGALVLSVLAVVLDRVNFPQKPFHPKQIVTDGNKRASRDRTGAHIIEDPDDAAAAGHGLANRGPSAVNPGPGSQGQALDQGTTPEIAGPDNRV